MSIIPMKKYVAITSAAAQTAQASYKEMIARIFTTNTRFAANTVYEFTSSADVSDFAGANSIEALIASAYFGWISKSATQAQKISFFRYSAEALAPYLYSISALTPLATFKEVTNGAMVVNLGGTAYKVTGVNLSSVEDYAGVASAIQTAIQANSSGGALWTAATVTFDNTMQSFVLTGGETGANNISYAMAPDEGTDLSALLGWNSASNPVLSNGIEGYATIQEALNATVNISNNCSTIGFADFTIAETEENLQNIGSWLTEQNFAYRFAFDLGASNYATLIQTAQNYEGLTANYNVNYGTNNTVPAWIMSAILPATTNYDAENGTKSYMYQQFDSFPVSVGLNDETITYSVLDGLNINYNGQTQKSGAYIAFYQDGFNTNGVDSAVFDNEIHLKDAISTDIINAQLALDFISADNDGLAVITGILQNNCDNAVFNHTFAKGKTLSTADKAYITQITGNSEAWYSVQSNGYYYTCNIETETQNSKTIYKAVYTLVYSKNDTIRKVEGQNILI